LSKITVIRSTKTTAEKGYPIVELAYKTDDGKTKGMKIFGFGAQKEVAAVAGAAQTGDVLEAVFQQNQKGYWEFASLKNTGEAQPTPAVGGSSGNVSGGASGGSRGGNWETSEERAQRQVMIVRQSSLSTAVQFMEVAKIKPTPDDVINTAKIFEAYVLDKQPKGDVE
jgi:hypothetical protein